MKPIIFVDLYNKIISTHLIFFGIKMALRFRISIYFPKKYNTLDRLV